MSESEEETQWSVQIGSARRHRFRSLTQRRAATNVTAYRTVGALDAVEVSDLGTRTFFEESLRRWRELCSAEHFQSAVRELQPFLGHLPSVVHSRAAIWAILRGYLLPQAEFSLEPLMELLAALSRDLQGMYCFLFPISERSVVDLFVPFVPELISSINALCQALSERPEVLGSVFNGFSTILKRIKKHLLPCLTEFLSDMVRPLMELESMFVQKLSSQSIAHVLRQLTKKKLKLALRCVMGVVGMTRGSDPIMQGYASVVAHVCMGVEPTLHTKAHDVLELLFNGGLIQISHFRLRDASGQKTAPEWLTDAFLQRISFEFVRRVVTHLMRHLDKETAIELWKLLIDAIEQKLGKLNGTDSVTEAIQEVAFLVSLVSQILFFQKGVLVMSLQPISRLLQSLSSSAVLQDLIPSDGEDFSRELATLLVHVAKLKNSDRHWSACEAQLYQLERFIVQLSVPDLLSICREAIADTTAVKILGRAFAQQLARVLMDRESKTEYHERAWMLMDRLLQALFSADIVHSGTDVWEDIQFLHWLKKSAKQWPHDSALPNRESLQPHCQAVRGVLIAKSLSRVCVPDHQTTIGCATIMLESVQELAVAAESAGVYCQILTVLAEAEMNQGRQQGENLVHGLTQHLEDALRRLKSAPHLIGYLKCVSNLLKMVQSASCYVDEPCSDSEMDPLPVFDVTALFSPEEMKAWIGRLEQQLAVPESQTRQSVLELFSLFDPYLTEDATSGLPLLSTLLEIERADFNGVDRKAVRLVEDLKSRIEQGLLPEELHSACFYGLMGLLHIQFKPIWKLASSALSQLLNSHCSRFWPRVFKRIQILQSALIEGTGSARGEQKSIDAFSFEGFYEKEILMQPSVETGDPGTDALTEMTHLVDAIAGLESAQLTPHLVEWVPVLLEWIGRNPRQPRSDQEAAGKLLESKVWVKGAQILARSLLTVDSLECCPERDRLLKAIGSLLAEAEIQEVALKLLSKFDLKVLARYGTSLHKMTEKEGRTHTLVHFQLMSDGGSIERADRQHLIPIMIHLLYPHIKALMVKQKKRGDAVLSYLSSADAHELMPLIELTFHSVSHLIKAKAGDQREAAERDGLGLFGHLWWYPRLRDAPLEFWMDRIEIGNGVSTTDRSALLRRMDCLLFNLGHKLTPYHPFLMAWMVALLSGCVEKESLDVLCISLSLLAAFLKQFPDACSFPELLTALLPSLQKMASSLNPSQPQELYAFYSTGCRLTDCHSRVEATVELMRAVCLIPAFLKQLSGVCERDDLTPLLSPVISLLSHPHLPHAIRTAVLDITDLCIESEEDNRIQMREGLLQKILESLRDYILSSPGKSRSIQHDSGRPLQILERLLALHGTPEALNALSHAMFSILTSSSRGVITSEAALLKTLKCISVLFNRAAESGSGVFSEEELCQFAAVLSKKVLKFESRDARSHLSAALIALSCLLPDLAAAAEILASLTSFIQNQLDEVDYDQRLEAYEKLPEVFWSQQRKEATDILLNACLFDLQNEQDFTLRQASSTALHKLVSYEAESGHSIKTGLFEKLMSSIGCASLAVRQEQLSLLWTLLERDVTGTFAWASALSSQDKESDFFHNVAHFQISRRIRAWQRVMKHLQTFSAEDIDSMEIETQPEVLKMTKLLMPLLQQAIFEGKPQQKRHNMSNLSQEVSLVETCVQVLSILASLLQWGPYQRLLNQLMAQVQKTHQPTKGMIRALCVVVDSFHFETQLSTTPLTQPSTDEPSNAEGIPNGHMYEMLCQRVIPALNSLLLNEAREKARLPVAVSLAKLHSKLPHSAQTELPGLLLKVANLLLHRVQHIRDDARKVYVSMAVALGSVHLPICLQSLIRALPMKGYTAHVLEHAIHSVLDKMGEAETGFRVDAVVSMVLPIVDAALFGEPAEARDAKQFSSKYQEAKSTCSKDTFQLLCRFCTFQTDSITLMAFLQEKLSLCHVPRHRRVVEALMHHFVQGLISNPSACLTEKLRFLHSIIQEGVSTESEVHQIMEQSQLTTLEQMEQQETERKKHVQSKQTMHSYLLAESALAFLRSLLKKSTFSSSDSLAEMDRCVPLMIACLHGRHGNVASLALKSLSLMSPLPLPTLKESASDAANAVIKLLDSVPTVNDPVAQDCLRLLARILHTGDQFQPTLLQVNALLTLIGADLEEQSEQQAAFKLLRSIIERKIVVPKVYDLMLKIREMMIRSHSTPVRQMASSLFLQFLLSFPLSDQQLQQHLVFILANLSYEYETGRVQAIDMVHQVVMKFPMDFIREKHALFYFPLIQRFIHESIPTLKTAVTQVVKCLLERLEDSEITALIQMNLASMESEEESRHLLGSQAMVLLLDTHPALCRSYEDSMLQFCESTLSRHISDTEAQQGEALEWKELYCCLHLLEKLCENGTSSVLSSFQGQLWREIVELLRFPHAWIRAAAVRLVGHAFMALEPQIDSLLSVDAHGILGDKTAAQLAFACYTVLESDTVDERTARHCTKNLVWLAPILSLQSSCMPRKSDSETQGAPQQTEEATQPGLSLMGIIHRMNKLANLRSESSELLRISAFKFLGALAIRLSNFSCLDTYLPLMLQPIYRLMECKELRPTEENAKEIAQHVMEHMRGLVDRDLFISSYAEAKREVEETRNKRKAKEALQKVTNPEGVAKRRLAQNRKKSAAKKRKPWLQLERPRETFKKARQ